MNTYNNIGFNKKDFVQQVEERIYLACAKVDKVTSDEVIAAYSGLVGKVLADPTFEEIVIAIRMQVGRSNLPHVLDWIKTEPSDASYHKAPVEFDNQYAGRTRCRVAYPSPDLWEIGGVLRELLDAYGLPEKCPDRTSAAAQLGLEYTLLTGAFATSKAKYWDMLYPPTERFLAALETADNLTRIKEVIRVYVLELA